MIVAGDLDEGGSHEQLGDPHDYHPEGANRVAKVVQSAEDEDEAECWADDPCGENDGHVVVVIEGKR